MVQLAPWVYFGRHADGGTDEGLPGMNMSINAGRSTLAEEQDNATWEIVRFSNDFEVSATVKNMRSGCLHPSSRRIHNSGTSSGCRLVSHSRYGMRTQSSESFAHSSVAHTTESHHMVILLLPTCSTAWQGFVKSQRAKEGHLPTKGFQVQVLAGMDEENPCCLAVGILLASSATGSR